MCSCIDGVIARIKSEKPVDEAKNKLFKTKEDHDDFLKFIKEIFPDCPIDLLPKFN